MFLQRKPTSMWRFWRIFLLYTQYALEYRSISFVWFLVTLINASMYLLFWRGALTNQNTSTQFWTISSAISYYILLIIAGGFLHAHIEEDVAYEDIQKGDLVKYLTRPLSYFWFKYFLELPWRIIQGFFGIVVFVGVVIFYKPIPIVHTVESVSLTALIIFLAYHLSFVYKMIIGLAAFWMTDSRGLLNLEAIVFLLLAGFVIPLSLFPLGVRSFVLFQPLAYMIYYPILAIQGVLNASQLLQVVMYQVIWFLILVIVYKMVWTLGLKRFTGIGQ